MRNRYESSGATGGIVEEELFGKSLYEKETHLDMEHYEYFSKRNSFEVLKDMQPFDDPTEPDPDFANAVHCYVFEGLEIDAKDLRFYTAVKSPLDRFHKVDGWFEIGEGRKTTMVTVDLTLNPKKGEYKADIVFLVPEGGLDRKVDKKQFIQYSEKLAEEVIEFFKERGR